ncbi:MAG: HU family DNA-binding protein, partial [Clostridia bacterium]|nr:HU family DNA-binding protein [Clostridia bacterium]
MTKAELIQAIAAKDGCTKKDAEKNLNVVLDTITEQLIKGEKISLIGFGTF